MPQATAQQPTLQRCVSNGVKYGIMMPWALKILQRKGQAPPHTICQGLSSSFIRLGQLVKIRFQETAAYSAVPAFRTGTKGVLHSDVYRQSGSCLCPEICLTPTRSLLWLVTREPGRSDLDLMHASKTPEERVGLSTPWSDLLVKDRSITLPSSKRYSNRQHQSSRDNGVHVRDLNATHTRTASHHVA